MYGHSVTEDNEYPIKISYISPKCNCPYPGLRYVFQYLVPITITDLEMNNYDGHASII